jgi:hypothetical protein
LHSYLDGHGRGEPVPQMKPGDRVYVAWGLDDVLGTVIDVFGPAREPYVRVRITLGDESSGQDEIEVPIKMSDLRPALSSPGAEGAGTFEVTSVRKLNDRLVVEVRTRWDSESSVVLVTAPPDETRRLESLLGHDRAQSELALFALHVVATQLESGESIANYLLIPQDVNQIHRTAKARDKQ